ncbi:hypothetical protein R4P64_31225 [Rhodococcus sp. IEGM 1366]|nr:hypothetical protein [Rhodococcus sp. IEGM 1366]MDV8070995.1 hypothetical protein [Rhodococcus sp. IEGM 1366]
MSWAKSKIIWACRQVTTKCVAASDDTDQPFAFIVVEFSHSR